MQRAFHARGTLVMSASEMFLGFSRFAALVFVFLWLVVYLNENEHLTLTSEQRAVRYLAMRMTFIDNLAIPVNVDKRLAEKRGEH